MMELEGCEWPEYEAQLSSIWRHRRVSRGEQQGGKKWHHSIYEVWMTEISHLRVAPAFQLGKHCKYC